MINDAKPSCCKSSDILENIAINAKLKSGNVGQ
jgi:hypothetical protein